MTTLGIFTVKKLCWHAGRYFTYGGFGDYLAAMRARFPRTVLVAHVREMAPPEGHYEIPPGTDLEVVHLPAVQSELGVLLTLPIMFLRSWTVARQMDVAHVRMPDYTGIVGAVVCRAQGVPCFCQIVADWSVQARATPATRMYGLGLLMKLHLYVYDAMERLACRGQLVFAQGQSCFDKHRRHSTCELVLSAAHHFDDIVVPPRRFQRHPFTILNVARLTGVKNQQLILQALGRLLAEGEDWRVKLVGEGPSLDALRAKVSELGLHERVEFVGQVQRGADLWRHFDAADCFVLCSRSEGTPKVLLEAMARGLPIVASAVGGVESLLGNMDRGLLFQDNDLVGLVGALRRMAMESELRNQLVENATAFAIQNTVEVATDSMLKKVFARWPQLGEISRGAR